MQDSKMGPTYFPERDRTILENTIHNYFMGQDKYLGYFKLRISHIRPSSPSTPTFEEFDQGLWVW